MNESNAGVERKTNKERQRRWDVLITGLIMVWVGVVVFADLGWSAGLLGVGMILLLEQALQWRWKVGLDGFYLGGGAIAAAAGGAGIAGINVPVVAVALIAGGLWLAGTALTSKASR